MIHLTIFLQIDFVMKLFWSWLNVCIRCSEPLSIVNKLTLSHFFLFSFSFTSYTLAPFTLVQGNKKKKIFTNRGRYWFFILLSWDDFQNQQNWWYYSFLHCFDVWKMESNNCKFRIWIKYAFVICIIWRLVYWQWPNRFVAIPMRVFAFGEVVTQNSDNDLCAKNKQSHWYLTFGNCCLSYVSTYTQRYISNGILKWTFDGFDFVAYSFKRTHRVSDEEI